MAFRWRITCLPLIDSEVRNEAVDRSSCCSPGWGGGCSVPSHSRRRMRPRSTRCGCRGEPCLSVTMSSSSERLGVQMLLHYCWFTAGEITASLSGGRLSASLRASTG